MNKETVKEIVFSRGADLFGIASVDRFDAAPKGFHPRDVYPLTKSIITFAIKIPGESLFASNPIPYTQINAMAMSKIDLMTFDICIDLEKNGLKVVPIPTDDPYISYNPQESHGQAILSLRHTGYLAGLGKLGKNNLLINKDFGNMIQIGAILTATEFEADPLASYEVCPEDCSICLDNCPVEALTGETVVQKWCRPLATHQTEKGFTIKKCFECRKNCPQVFGVKSVS
jgi:epoxyqueuosine reductase QueG